MLNVLLILDVNFTPGGIFRIFNHNEALEPTNFLLSAM
ncbi:hypothetical protein BN136_2158 [Cronobacter universalis NCTC 9529]|nr:hypothetical protein BN136_2158 [Cronobacter universalis NCTC 9529]